MKVLSLVLGSPSLLLLLGLEAPLALCDAAIAGVAFNSVDLENLPAEGVVLLAPRVERSLHLVDAEAMLAELFRRVARQQMLQEALLVDVDGGLQGLDVA